MTRPYDQGRDERVTFRITAKGKRAIQRRAGKWRCSPSEVIRHMLEFAEREMGADHAGPRD